jgi:hypothetical protein
VLIDRLRAHLGEPRAASFRLAGEDLALLGLDDLRAAVAGCDAAIPPAVRDELLAEEAALAHEAHALLRTNRSVAARVAGYRELGRRCGHAYPWPVVAILGIQQVEVGISRNRWIGIAGRVVGRFARIADLSEDILRRTNRGIFADSVPTVLRALRGAALRRAGRDALADAVLDGVAAPWFDAESATLARAIADGLARDDFAQLAATTRLHFAREQAIFTHHLGRGREPIRVTSVPAPRIEHGALVTRPYALPHGFDLRDHDARVRELGRAFVDAVTGSRADYLVAAAAIGRESR